MKKPLVIIAGPTAVGKTDLSVEYAKKINGEIISADSMQIYKYMDIGTAKIKPEEMMGIKHYLIDEISPDEEYNVFKFKDSAKKYINKIHDAGKIPIIVGGTGFYIQSVLYDIDFSLETDDGSYRNNLEEISAKDGGVHAYNLLKKTDPLSAELIHPKNIKRVIRALEYHHITGDRISEHNKIQKEKTSPYDFRYFVLNRQRNEIYDRIEKRVDKMIDDGLTDEVKNLLDSGVSPKAQSMQGLGYKEIVEYLYGSTDLETAISKIKINTRHFAKRQITWFKREACAIWIDCDAYHSKEEIVEELINKSF